MRRGLSSLVVLSLLAAGCEGAISNAGTGDAEATTTSAVVVVERAVDPPSVARVQASARFVRVPASSAPDDALRAIGASVDLPARGSCAPLGSSTADVAADGTAPVVELVDVGAVSMEAEGVETLLTARQLPDVTDVVSGIVYARTGDPAVFPAATHYVLHVAGHADLPAFDIAGSAPSDPNDVRFAGEPAAGGPLTVGTGATVDVSWTPDGTADAIYVDVQPASVRCTLGDGEGDAEAAHAGLPASLLGAEGTLAIHRLHREEVRAAGSLGGEMRFDFARTLRYARR
jgi:hypothetical protein